MADISDSLSEPEADAEGSRSKKLILVAAVIVFVFIILPIILFVGIVYWQMGVFNTGPGGSMGVTSITSTGFSKIKPQLAAVSLTNDGKFEGTFTNGVGAGITVDWPGIILADHGGNRCTLTPLPDQKIQAGDNFRIEAFNCPKGQDGTYTLEVKIPYKVKIGNIETSHTDMGTIRGPVE